MGQPPDPPDLHKLHSTTTNTSTMEFSNGPKYLIMERVNNNNENKTKNDSLENVSPFLIKKVIDHTCNGVVDECKKMRNGAILIKTKDHKQATKLLKLSTLSPEITVKITEHPTLNTCKGVIYCNDLRSISEEEILNELRSQNVAAIKKITKKKGNDRIETGLIILTFALHDLPEYIAIGYQRTKVRTYIPLPMRCHKCLRFGHTLKVCQAADKICTTCGNKQHCEIEEMDKCTNGLHCVNCSVNDLNHNHSTFDRKCPIFLKEQEIIAIKTTLKIDNKAAHAVYKSRHHGETTFATVLSKNSPASTPKPTPKPTTNDDTSALPSKPIQRTVLNYDDINELIEDTNKLNNTKGTTGKKN